MIDKILMNVEEMSLIEDEAYKNLAAACWITLEMELEDDTPDEYYRAVTKVGEAYLALLEDLT